MIRFVATLRAIYNATDEVEAVFIADQIRLNGAIDLDEIDSEDEGTDILEVTQVTSNNLDLTPEEVIVQLKRARNLLIKTRVRECYNLAKELDQQIYKLQHRGSDDFAMAGYQHGDFMDLTEQILIEGKMPDV